MNQKLDHVLRDELITSAPSDVTARLLALTETMVPPKQQPQRFLRMLDTVLRYCFALMVIVGLYITLHVTGDGHSLWPQIQHATAQFIMTVQYALLNMNMLSDWSSLLLRLAGLALALMGLWGISAILRNEKKRIVKL